MIYPFISETYIKENSAVFQNVDPKYLRPATISAQNIRIQEAIKTPLYKKLQSLMPTAINLPVNAVYKTLLDEYIAPALLHWTIVEMLYVTSAKITNKGICTESSDNSTPLTTDELIFYVNKYEHDAEFATQRLIAYLEAHSSSYPEYYQYIQEGVDGTTNAYFSGTYLPEYDDEPGWCHNGYIRKIR